MMKSIMFYSVTILLLIIYVIKTQIKNKTALKLPIVIFEESSMGLNFTIINILNNCFDLFNRSILN